MKNPSRMARMAPMACVALLSILSAAGHAVEIVSCQGSDGRIGFYQSCPPGTVQTGSQSYRSSPGSDPNAGIHATVYAIPECDSCVEVREFLDTHNISYDEKMVHEDIEIQNELRDVSGSLSAPTTIIGNEIIKGYNRDKLMSALLASGYAAPDSEQQSP